MVAAIVVPQQCVQTIAGQDANSPTFATVKSPAIVVPLDRVYIPQYTAPTMIALRHVLRKSYDLLAYVSLGSVILHHSLSKLELEAWNVRLSSAKGGDIQCIDGVLKSVQLVPNQLIALGSPFILGRFILDVHTLAHN